MKKNLYEVVVLGGYSGKVATRYFDSKPKMLSYVSKVTKNASELRISNLKQLESRFGPPGEQKDHSRVDWA